MLLPVEQSAILSHAKDGLSVCDIALKVNHSRMSVHGVIKRGHLRAGARRSGPKRRLTISTRRLILRKARTGQFTAWQRRQVYAPHVSVRRV